MSAKLTHGGKRPGAGKPAFFSSPMTRHNVMLDERSLKLLIELGKGKLSAGIREAVRIIFGLPSMK